MCVAGPSQVREIPSVTRDNTVSLDERTRSLNTMLTARDGEELREVRRTAVHQASSDEIEANYAFICGIYTRPPCSCNYKSVKSTM